MDLPHPWEIRESKRYPGRCFYFNTETCESTWVRPARYPGSDPGPVWPPIIYLSQIQIKFRGGLGCDGVERTCDEAKALVEEIQDGIRLGNGTFEEMAKKHSDDRETSEGGGVVGWIKRAQIDGKLAETAWQLRIGEMSRPVKTDRGFFLLFRSG